MHEFAERGIASHWKYKSSEKFTELSWREYDWLKDLVEIIETGNSPEHYYEFTKLQMFQDNVFCFTPKGAVIKLPMSETKNIILKHLKFCKFVIMFRAIACFNNFN